MPNFRAQVIKDYKKVNDIAGLTENQIRLWIQPYGIVGVGYQVDLETRLRIKYWGTHEQDKEPIQDQVSEESAKRISTIIQSNQFKNMENDSDELAFDATSIIVEVFMSGQERCIQRYEFEEDATLSKLKELIVPKN